MPLPKISPIPVVIAEKTHKKGYLFGHISNGGGIIQLSNGKALKIIANQDWVTIQLLEYGLNIPIKTQSWVKSKKVVVKKEKTNNEIPKSEKIDGVEEI